MKSLISFLLFAFILISCSKEDEVTTSPNTTNDSSQPSDSTTVAQAQDSRVIIYNGDTSNLSQPLVLDQGSINDSLNNNDIYLMSETVFVNDEGNFDGSGNMLWFYTYSTSKAITPGTYTYSSENRNLTFDNNALNIYTNDQKSSLGITGELAISAIDDTYTITYNGVDAQGNPIYCYFERRFDFQLPL